MPRASLDIADLTTYVSVWDPAALIHAERAGRRTGTGAQVVWRGSPAGLEALVLDEPAVDERAPAARTLVRFAAAAASDRGAPVPPIGVVPGQIAGVLIHPGAGPFALVADSSDQIAAPAFGTTAERLALAWDLRDPRLAVREAPSPRPKLVTHRDVRLRLERVVPFFAAGATVTPVVRDDSLHFVVELFVTSDDYPLSGEVRVAGRAVRYARHAATAIVQAQTGRVILVPSESPDAVARSWMRRFPVLFTPLEGAPTWFRSARPAAIDVMLVQGAAISQVGFARDTLGRRSLARADGADAALADGPPTLVQLDSAGALGWAVAMDIPWSGRTLGILVARGGEVRRTEYHPAPGPRWTTVLELLQRAADAAGSGRTLEHARRGRVQVVPTRDGPAYIQSFYEWPPDAAPRLAGVAVLLAGEARAGSSLADALGVPSARGPGALPDEVFRARVSALYDAMQAALRAGEWSAYGEAWAALGRLLGRRPQ